MLWIVLYQNPRVRLEQSQFASGTVHTLRSRQDNLSEKNFEK